MKFLAILAATMLAGSAVSVGATTLIVDGTTVGQPTFIRPIQNGHSAPGSVAIGQYEFSAIAFHVDTDGSYQLDLTSAFDNFMVLYKDAFDPSQPLLNALVADDDFGVGRNATIIFDLVANTNYFAVATSYMARYNGPFTLSISGPGVIALNEVPSNPVPEPAAWAMMIAGFGAAGGAMRRRTYKLRAI